MYPARSVMDYVTEINRINATGSENDKYILPTPSNACISSFNQSSMARSSSSTDTSPDSLHELSVYRLASDMLRSEVEAQAHSYQRAPRWRQDHDTQLEPEVVFDTHGRPYFVTAMEHINKRSCQNWMNSKLSDTPINPEVGNVRTEFETPLTVGRQRPIIGRKIMANTETQTLNTMDELNTNLMWHPENLLHTPPRSYEQKYIPNVYELFPAERRAFEFQSPAKSSTHVSPTLSASPKMTSLTPPTKSPFSPRMPTPFKEPFVGPSASFNPSKSPKMCTFCRKNGETPVVYATHNVKEKIGIKTIVTCPILRSHVCSTCGVSGDNAHTITYCPVLRSDNNGKPLQSTTIKLKNTRVKSNGRRRY